jgi:hypothetical protein
MICPSCHLLQRGELAAWNLVAIATISISEQSQQDRQARYGPAQAPLRRSALSPGRRTRHEQPDLFNCGSSRNAYDGRPHRVVGFLFLGTRIMKKTLVAVVMTVAVFAAGTANAKMMKHHHMKHHMKHHHHMMMKKKMG